MKCRKWPGCPNEAAPGRVSCQRCLDRHKASRDKMIALAVKEGYCRRCRKNPAPGGKLCARCRDYAKTVYRKGKLKKYARGDGDGGQEKGGGQGHQQPAPEEGATAQPAAREIRQAVRGDG